MPKQKETVFICGSCGYQTPKWMGRCPGCGQWNSLVEKVKEQKKVSDKRKEISSPIPIKDISIKWDTRIKTDMEEFDRILGGGIVPGSVILIGGDPGIGKSTLMLQVLNILSKKGIKCLYLSGEESLEQIKMRAERLRVDASELYIATGTNLEELLETIKFLKPNIIVVDSIQTLYTDTISSTPGSMAQVREITYRLQLVAKQSGIPIFLIGHVTKEGVIAGPKVLEHLVDTVLYFEGDA
ncbi:MAG: DNA repair protein RadA, partial [Deltaproteobacteria bacterium]